MWLVNTVACLSCFAAPIHSPFAISIIHTKSCFTQS